MTLFETKSKSDEKRKLIADILIPLSEVRRAERITWHS
jgi:hypothetical protein